MSLDSTKAQLIQLLDDDGSRVVALSGKWGTGKSFMWTQAQKDSAISRVKGALYTSLFGLSSIDQIKIKLIQDAAPEFEKNPALVDGAKTVLGGAMKVLEGFHSGFRALNDVGLLVAPAVLRRKLIVIDDIERKHESLKIDEILGFIDEFTQRYESRFLLILNTDQLAHREVWDTLREKVVDQELRLTTTSDEAFAIASRKTPTAWPTPISTAVRLCGVTNIRIHSKIIRAVNHVIGERPQLSEAVLHRVIPSTVLLSAIHYRGIEDGPDTNFVLGFGRRGHFEHYLNPKKTSESQSEEDKSQARWRSLLSNLGIYSCEEFELVVSEYLQSGLFDASKVTAILDRFAKEQESTELRFAVHQFLERSFWDHPLTEAQLLEIAKPLVEKVHLMDANTVSSFHDALLELQDGSPLAAEAIQRWIEAYEPTIEEGQSLDAPFPRQVHPKIAELYARSKEKAQANTTLIEASRHIAEHSGWGTRQEMAFRLASVDEYEAAIRTAELSDLRHLLSKMLDFTANREQYLKYFGDAMDNFVEACIRIVDDEKVPRLAKILRHLFGEAKLDSLLPPRKPASPDAAK